MTKRGFLWVFEYVDLGTDNENGLGCKDDEEDSLDEKGILENVEYFRAELLKC